MVGRETIGGGVRGTSRIARHLWRMCLGLFVAAGFFFLGSSNRPLRLLSLRHGSQCDRLKQRGRRRRPPLVGRQIGDLDLKPDYLRSQFLKGMSFAFKGLQPKVLPALRSCRNPTSEGGGMYSSARAA